MPRIGLEPFRPAGFIGKGDKQLEKIHSQLVNLFKKIHKNLDRDDPLSLPRQAQDQVAGILVEFAEDIHNDIGLWRSLEYYNEKLFGRSLPLTTSSKKAMSGFSPLRIRHLLWKTWQAFEPKLVLAPDHVDLQKIAEAVSQFLTKRFTQVPRGSGIKKFLLRSNRYGWEVKRKLIWLGTHSYLFRHFFENTRSPI